MPQTEQIERKAQHRVARQRIRLKKMDGLSYRWVRCNGEDGVADAVAEAAVAAAFLGKV